MNDEEKNLKEEIKGKFKEMFAKLVKKSIEETLFEEYLKIAEDCVNNKPYNLETHLTMTGFVVEINRIIDCIEDEKIKEKFNEKAQIIWDKWYQKTQNSIDNDVIVKTLKKDIEEKSKN